MRMWSFFPIDDTLFAATYSGRVLWHNGKTFADVSFPVA
jgi:hypothetical protein